MSNVDTAPDPISARMVETPAGSRQEWDARMAAVLNDPPISPERLAQLMHEMEHPKPKIVIGSMRLACGATLDTLKRNLGHESEDVRAVAVEEAQALLKELAQLMDSMQAKA